MWERDGHLFDGGPTVITDPDCLQRLWRLSGQDMAADVDLVPITPFYALDWPDGTLRSATTMRVLFASIAALNPADVEGYKRFLAYSAGVFEEGYVKLGTKAFESVGDMLKAAPGARQISGMALGLLDRLEIRRRRPFAPGAVVSHLAGRRQSDDLLVDLRADPQARTRRRRVVRQGRHQPAGRRMVALFERLGGQIRLDDPVVGD